MMTLLFVLGGVELVSIAVLLVLFAAAPIGWQDEQGFHYGIEGDSR